ncbi:DUF6470 family protein [Anoxybacillus flavithermus]|uniref:DUF6470 family protein n=1 Tax=Anoxybacillus flavithermus TaxID=33934 RepID=UPI000AC48C1C|nr:DUF6470 family protein [Anoxybacillus flavithermus]MBE2940845.1 hypothetical protein [Anoxybacillus flavithermus]MBE2943534.1 hypothetical protein [Anoxybacillus flavithermus]MBE2951829.1 hypothetical protein [Anoxybacillus flavithermus]MBE2954420.1 hypothetical protein [Anoxybacillus flavithermus]MBE2959858.1 hypothetical protein [Anoxybacillus flavithermus]
MQLPQIRLQSTFAKIAIETTPPVQEIKQPSAELDLQQPSAEMKIETTPAKLTIDQTKAWEDMDLKHIFRRIEEFAQKGYEDWLEGIARVSRQGDELMRIEDGGNPLGEQAKENSEDPIYDFNIGWVPSLFSVKTNFEPAKVHIDVKVQQPIIRAKINKPMIHYTPGKVTMDLAQRNSLKIDFVNLKFVGTNFEISI